MVVVALDWPQLWPASARPIMMARAFLRVCMQCLRLSYGCKPPAPVRRGAGVFMTIGVRSAHSDGGVLCAYQYGIGPVAAYLGGLGAARAQGPQAELLQPAHIDFRLDHRRCCHQAAVVQQALAAPDLELQAARAAAAVVHAKVGAQQVPVAFQLQIDAAGSSDTQALAEPQAVHAHFLALAGRAVASDAFWQWQVRQEAL